MDQSYTFETLGSATDRVVKRLELQMRAQRNRHYQVPATEGSRRIDKLRCGEKDDD